MSAVSLSCDPGSQDQLRAVPVWITEKRIMEITIVFILVAIFSRTSTTENKYNKMYITEKMRNKTNWTVLARCVAWKALNKHTENVECHCCWIKFCDFKGSLTRDFCLQVFFIHKFSPIPSVLHWGHFKFLRKFAEIFAICAYRQCRWLWW